MKAEHIINLKDKGDENSKHAFRKLCSELLAIISSVEHPESIKSSLLPLLTQTASFGNNLTDKDIE
jgi:hypothetical protein